jgi:hypothetical protein
MASGMDVFFYGLFMDPDALRERGFNPTEPRRAQVEGMALKIKECGATLMLQSGASVHGVVLGLSRAELNRLYSDPRVAGYREEKVTARLESGSIITVLCYNLPRNAAKDGNPEYAAKLRAVAARMKLPEN